MRVVSVVGSRKVQGVILALLLFSSLPAVADLAASGTEGYKAYVTGTGDVIATYRNGGGLDTDTLHLDVFSSSPIFNNQTSSFGDTVDLGSFAIGTELIFRLNVDTSTNHWVDLEQYDLYTGPASRNSASGWTAARVSASTDWPGETVVSWEDQKNGDDTNGGNGELRVGVGWYNYEDLTFSFTNVAGQSGPSYDPPTPPVVPVPAAVLLGWLGLGTAGWRLSRRTH